MSDWIKFSERLPSETDLPIWVSEVSPRDRKCYIDSLFFIVHSYQLTNFIRSHSDSDRSGCVWQKFIVPEMPKLPMHKCYIPRDFIFCQEMSDGRLRVSRGVYRADCFFVNYCPICGFKGK